MAEPYRRHSVVAHVFVTAVYINDLLKMESNVPLLPSGKGTKQRERCFGRFPYPKRTLQAHGPHPFKRYQT
ncbi:hypothetical protein AGR5A_Lc70135 [Agrobacterium genomosp. 5 str. CFBP 6626]|nr:hypothetical protein AGR5A_Lc70135 [Agrobacterium genomosp. 5 str. CFBP 6626]